MSNASTNAVVVENTAPESTTGKSIRERYFALIAPPIGGRPVDEVTSALEQRGIPTIVDRPVNEKAVEAGRQKMAALWSGTPAAKAPPAVGKTVPQPVATVVPQPVVPAYRSPEMNRGGGIGGGLSLFVNPETLRKRREAKAAKQRESQRLAAEARAAAAKAKAAQPKKEEKKSKKDKKKEAKNQAKGKGR